jgi:predicted ATP-dependent protease
MLREEILDAVAEGKFHIWPVKSIDEGIEILTGVRAGERNDDGSFEEGTVNYLVDARLRKLAETLRDFGSKNNEKKEDDGEKGEDG